MSTPKSASAPPLEIQAAEQVVRHVALLIERGQLGPGDRLAAERELAQELGVSRPTVRAGLHAPLAGRYRPALNDGVLA